MVSGFYLALKICRSVGAGWLPSDMDFALSLLLERGVAVVPGSAYGASTSRFVRVSIGTESEERIGHALLMIRNLIRTQEFDHGRLRARLESSGIPVFGP